MIDWDDYQYFNAVIQNGGLSAAARVLGVSQPTVGRRISGLEKRLGQKLLEREGKHVYPTEYGLLLQKRITPLVQNAFRLEKELESFGVEDHPPVRITSTDGLALYWLPDMLGKLHSSQPAIRYLLMPGNQLEDVGKRDVDIAFRVGGKPTQGLIEIDLFSMENSIWASESYLAERGIPKCEEDLGAHSFIAFNESHNSLPHMKPFQNVEILKNIVFRADSVPLQARAVEAGMGLGVIPDYLAEQLGLTRVPWGKVITATGFTMISHPSALEEKHIKTVWDYFRSIT